MSGDRAATAKENEVAAHIQALIDRKRYQHARQLANEALPRFPDSEALIYLSSYLDWVEGRLDDAEQSLRHLLHLNPEHYGGRIQNARLLGSRGDNEGAEHAWIQLLGEDPENADLSGEYAELMLGKSQNMKAIELATEGLRHQPEHDHCLYVAAIATMRQYGQLEGNSAIIDLMRHHPSGERSAFVQLVALERKRKYRESYRLCQEMLREYPDSEAWLANARTFKVLSHWSMLPLHPFQRSGFVASMAAFLVMTILLMLGTMIFPDMPAEAKSHSSGYGSATRCIAGCGQACCATAFSASL